MTQQHAGKATTVVFVGGFLGAGKTTLLLAAANELKKLNLRSALIMNDQGSSLVDSELAALGGATSREVTGGCFCCRFSDLAKTLEELVSFSPDVILAEPVGSCTDISATTLQPLQAYGDFRLAPFTVLVDPERAAELLSTDADQNLGYLFRKQIEEADIVCCTKADIHSTCPDLSAFASAAHFRQLSAQTGQGVAAWLDEVLSGRLMSGHRILDVDYQQYAMAEAALAWLNLHVYLRATPAITPAALLGPFFDQLSEDLSSAGLNVVHMKAIMQCAAGFVKAAITRNRQVPKIDGNRDASPCSDHELLFNLRVSGAAAEVRKLVEANLNRIDAEKCGLELDCFHPAAPVPQHRFSRVAGH